MINKNPRTKSQHKIYIIDDHPIVRKGFIQLLNEESDLEVCGEAASAEEALSSIPTLGPDIVTVDLSLESMHGLDLIQTLTEKFSALPILVVSMHDEGVYAERCLRAGAKGYVMKQEASEKVVEAIHQILGGRVYLSDRLQSNLILKLSSSPHQKSNSEVDALSDRELMVFQMIGQGKGTRQISEKLCLSVKTIETYRAHIKNKLNLQTATELVERAVLWVQNESSSQ